MALETEEILRIDALLEALGSTADAEAVSLALKRLVPGMGSRLCDAADVLEVPFRSAGAVDLHLLDASSHCIRVTDQPSETTAILIARKESV